MSFKSQRKIPPRILGCHFLPRACACAARELDGSDMAGAGGCVHGRARWSPELAMWQVAQLLHNKGMEVRFKGMVGHPPPCNYLI